VIKELLNNNNHYINEKLPFYRKPYSFKADYVLTIKLPYKNLIFGDSIMLKFAENFYNVDFSSQNFRVEVWSIEKDIDKIVYDTYTMHKNIKIKMNYFDEDGFAMIAYQPLNDKQQNILELGDGVHLFHKLSKVNISKYNIVRGEYEQLFNNNSENSLFQKLVEAYFFDKHELYVDATTSFEELMSLGGNKIKEFVSFYNAFFERHK
jgi:hypothetical protein